MLGRGQGTQGTHAGQQYLSSTVRICSAGLHLSFRMSRQMRPSLSMFCMGIAQGFGGRQ